MMTARARQELSRTEQAGLLARAALTVAAGRMGGPPPQPFLEGEDAFQAEIIEEVRQRLEIAPDHGSEEALRAIEDALDAEMEAVAEPVDFDATLARAAAVAMRTDQAPDARAGDAETEPAVSAPSFRLRPQMPKLPSGALFPLKATTAEAGPGTREGTPVQREAPGAGTTAAEKSGDAPLSTSPQERFQEWGRLRAPVRELERPPSLFERVTASFSRRRPERSGEPEPALAAIEGGKPRLPMTEEDPKGATKEVAEAKKPTKEGCG